MKDLRLTIKIDKSAQEVFDFTLDSKNTPKWIDFITVEETNEWPPKLGTIYRNKGASGDWHEYELTAFEPGKVFVLSRKDVPYHVRYTFTPLDDNSCELEYYEWMDDGDLEDVLTMGTLGELKRVVEGK